MCEGHQLLEIEIRSLRLSQLGCTCKKANEGSWPCTTDPYWWGMVTHLVVSFRVDFFIWIGWKHYVLRYIVLHHGCEQVSAFSHTYRCISYTLEVISRTSPMLNMNQNPHFYFTIK